MAVANEPAPVVPLRQRVRREMATGMLMAAEEVFSESGLGKAHVEDIARRAGVAVGTLYNYYKDRDALLAEVLTSRIEELNAEMDAAIDATLGSPVRVALLEITRAYFRFFLRRRTFVRILSEGELTKLTDAYPTAASIPTQCWQGFREQVERVMERGMREGDLKSDNADLDLWLFLGLMRGVVMRDLKGLAAVRVEDAERVVQVFFDGALT